MDNSATTTEHALKNSRRGLAKLLLVTSLLVCHYIVKWLEIVSFSCRLYANVTVVVAVCLPLKFRLYSSREVSILSCCGHVIF